MEIFGRMSRLILPVILLAAIHSQAGFATDYTSTLNRVPSIYRADVDDVLSLAAGEWNDCELIEALNTYPQNTMKHRAVCFLVANMDKHLYVDYVWSTDPMNPFSPDDDSDGDWLREYVPDYGTVSADLLIENVEWAFRAREDFPWCASLPENVFFEYVLPYRSTQEPVHSWRPMLYETLAPMVEGLDNSLDVAEVVNRYNTEIFHFDPLYYRHPEDRDIPTCLATGVGRCEDMSNLSNYSLRAVGVPTTSDFTPRWPKGDNNHAWNVVYYDGTWYSFMGCEYSETNTWDSIKSRDFAKVYRKSFAADPIMGSGPDGTEPPRLMRLTALDVTAEYTSVSDITVDIFEDPGASFLCVYNYGAWQAVAGAWVNDDIVDYTDVGNHGILYCVTRYVENETGWGDHLAISFPFILHDDGSFDYLNPCPLSEYEGDITLSGWNTNALFQDESTVWLYRYLGNMDYDPTDPESKPMYWGVIGSGEPSDVDGSLQITFPDAGLPYGLYILSDNDNPDDLREGSRPFVWTADGISYH